MPPRPPQWGHAPTAGGTVNRWLSCRPSGSAVHKVRPFPGSLCSVAHQHWCMMARQSPLSWGQLRGPLQLQNSQGAGQGCMAARCPLPRLLPQHSADLRAPPESAPSQSQRPRGPSLPQTSQSPSPLLTHPNFHRYHHPSSSSHTSHTTDTSLLKAILSEIFSTYRQKERIR